MNIYSKLAAAGAFAFASAFAAAQDTAHAEHGAAAHQLELAEGEIRKIDKETGKLTIRHGELKNLGMQPMTMVFRTRDAGMLDRVEVGDKVKFAAERANGAITITHLENMRATHN